MAVQLQLRQGTTTEHNTFKGAVGEVTVDTTKDVPVVHDGVTVGGHPVASKANADGTISLIKKDGTSAGTINALGLFNNTLTSTNTNQALTAAQGKSLEDRTFGTNQNCINVTSSRAFNTTYTNSTTRVKFVLVTTTLTSASRTLSAVTSGNTILPLTNDGNGAVNLGVVFPVLAGATYRVDSNGTILSWWELG